MDTDKYLKSLQDDKKFREYMLREMIKLNESLGKLNRTIEELGSCIEKV